MIGSSLFAAKVTKRFFPDETTVVEACGRLIDFRAWDPMKIDPRGWLNNFSESERGFALILLSRFTFLSEHLVDQLFRSAFHCLSNMTTDTWETFDTAQAGWRRFCNEAIVTIVQGERPNPSDSGWLFARKARQTIGLSEEQLFEPAEVALKLSQGFSGPVVFVDDFVGSGEQFLKTWERQYPISGTTTSFENESMSSSSQFYYCNAMTTEYGQNRIRDRVPKLKISAGNIIPARYSLVHPNSLLWPEAIRPEGIRFVEEVGRRLGFNADDGGENDWRGFHKLGLALAFQHSVPDANLPLFFTNNGGWTPLVRRL
ncbi:hypothetical protein J2X48_004619 [Bosea sp. BE271]|uniref:phosphoribosyltransferase-like protein n=1 Tax=Bosea TaxID=85413 RepID=UPI00285A454E|nr:MULTISPECIES: hypothetical protein [Bosea]MDR6830837.1 hypothetical protein [Bosea robiniae]MDR6897621.1 hypothetical protein [Bosea sp. BE109]MDR7141018.1 hypothetical protein [Bosea sp. BE168]MDR7177672.1 hypothetical protein [Bosea sp. BE271]